ncbi:MAG: hypothetical protein LUD07_11560 [Clostridiales bacterium]|nr:hypothetical protein [Clostridiales bacterium]
MICTFAINGDCLREEVRDVMGGKVIMTEALRILNQAGLGEEQKER